MERKVWGIASKVYTMGLHNWSRIRNKFKVLFNIQTYRNRVLSIKGICIREFKIKINQTIIVISRISNTIRTKEKRQA